MTATRPKGPVPVWATDATMVAPLTAYDGTPTKVRPSAGLIAAGYLPKEMVPPERINWKENDQDRRLAVLDLMEARNFVEIGSADTGVGTAVGDYAGARWAQGETIYHATSGDVVQKSEDGGYSWTADHTLATLTYKSIATREGAAKTGATVACGTHPGGTARISVTGASPGGTVAWADTTLSGSGTTNRAEVVVADPFVTDVFLVGGNDHSAADFACVWRVVVTDGTFVSQTKITLTLTSPARIVCAGPTNKLAASWSGSSNLIWRWVDGDTLGTAVVTPTTDEIIDIQWLPEDGLYLLVARNGSSSVSLWTSPTGVTGSWTAVNPTATGTNVFAGASGVLRGACVRGSVIIIPVTYSSRNFLMVSGDAGASWEAIADPMLRHAAITQRVRDLGSRFIAAGFMSGTEVGHALSLRAG